MIRFLELEILIVLTAFSSNFIIVLRKELIEVFDRIPYSPKLPDAKLEVRSIIAKPLPSIISWSLENESKVLLVVSHNARNGREASRPASHKAEFDLMLR